jgi:hypothetical protein
MKKFYENLSRGIQLWFIQVCYTYLECVRTGCFSLSKPNSVVTISPVFGSISKYGVEVFIENLRPFPGSQSAAPTLKSTVEAFTLSEIEIR